MRVELCEEQGLACFQGRALVLFVVNANCSYVVFGLRSLANEIFGCKAVTFHISPTHPSRVAWMFAQERDEAWQRQRVQLARPPPSHLFEGGAFEDEYPAEYEPSSPPSLGLQSSTPHPYSLSPVPTPVPTPSSQKALANATRWIRSSSREDSLSLVDELVFYEATHSAGNAKIWSLPALIVLSGTSSHAAVSNVSPLAFRRGRVCQLHDLKPQHASSSHAQTVSRSSACRMFTCTRPGCSTKYWVLVDPHNLFPQDHPWLNPHVTHAGVTVLCNHESRMKILPPDSSSSFGVPTRAKPVSSSHALAAGVVRPTSFPISTAAGVSASALFPPSSSSLSTHITPTVAPFTDQLIRSQLCAILFEPGVPLDAAIQAVADRIREMQDSRRNKRQRLL